MSDDYRLFVSPDGTKMVRIWLAQILGEDETVEIATRDHPDAIWGPPVVLKEER
jgi:hypothetical protein